MPNSSPLGTEKPQEGQDFRQRLEPASVRKAKLARLRQDALKTDQEFAQEERAADQEPPADTMETIPIIVKRTETAVASLSQTERQKDRSFPLQTIRTVVTWGFGFWQTVGRSVARRVGWTPRVAPYVGYGTTKYVRLICRTVLGMKHLAPADTVSLGIRNMLMLPAPRTLVRMKIDDAPVHTAQIGSSELFNPLDGSADLGSNSIVSDARSQASGIIREANEQAQFLAGQENVVSIATQKARNILDQAQEKANQLTSGANAYATKSMNDLDEQVTEIHNSIVSGLEVLKQRQKEAESQVPRLSAEDYPDHQ